VYTLLYQQVEQFRRQRGTMAVRDIDAAQKSYEDVLMEAVQRLKPERRLRGLAPEERLADLDRDQQALALPIEVLRVLPDAYIGSLSPEIQEEIRRRLQLTSH
jgi:hypothetical protein